MRQAVVIQYPKSLAGPAPTRPVLHDISVVIPTLGRPILETCLCYLVDGSVWPAAVIVVDQGRESAVAKMVDRLQDIGLHARYIPSAQWGKSAGVNRGLEQIETRFVAITDDDCFVAADWLEVMAARLRRDPGAIITGRVELAGDGEVPFSTVLSTEPRTYTKPQLKVHPFVGGNVGMAMALTERIGSFDEHPSLAAAAEDTDYGYRALRLGIPIAYDPDVLVHHYHWRDAAGRAARYADYARGQGAFYGKHLRRGEPLVLMQAIRDLLRSPLRWLRGLIQRDRELADNGRASTLNLLPGIIGGLRRRPNEQTVPDADSAPERGQAPGHDRSNPPPA